MQTRGNGLTHIHIPGNHNTVHGRIDIAILQVQPRPVQIGLGLQELGFRLFKTGSRGAVLRLRLSYCRLRLFEFRAGGIGIRLGIVIIIP